MPSVIKKKEIRFAHHNLSSTILIICLIQKKSNWFLEHYYNITKDRDKIIKGRNKKKTFHDSKRDK